MCQFQSLYYNDDGYVIRCAECSCFQVAFGTTMLTLVEEDFEVFRTMVAQADADSQEMPPQLRNISLPTPGQGVYLLLTRGELRALGLMLDKADTELTSRQLLTMFQS